MIKNYKLNEKKSSKETTKLGPSYVNLNKWKARKLVSYLHGDMREVFQKKFDMTKTSQFFSIHQENACNSCLHSNLIIFNDFHSYTANEDKHLN